MTRRSRAREVAVQVLYQSEVNPGTVATDIESFLVGRLRAAPLVDFARLLVVGVDTHCGELDKLLDARSENWRLSRMAATDRAVLRIALFELLHTDVPGPVAVDEAIQLARRYGSEASSRFVSGILGKLLADRDAATILSPDA